MIDSLAASLSAQVAASKRALAAQLSSADLGRASQAALAVPRSATDTDEADTDASLDALSERLSAIDALFETDEQHFAAKTTAVLCSLQSHVRKAAA